MLTGEKKEKDSLCSNKFAYFRANGLPYGTLKRPTGSGLLPVEEGRKQGSDMVDRFKNWSLRNRFKMRNERTSIHQDRCIEGKSAEEAIFPIREDDEMNAETLKLPPG